MTRSLGVAYELTSTGVLPFCFLRQLCVRLALRVRPQVPALHSNRALTKRRLLEKGCGAAHES